MSEENDMAETTTTPGGGTNVTIVQEALDAAVGDWMEMAPQAIQDTIITIMDEFGGQAAERDIADIISNALPAYHSALHEMAS